MNNVCVKPEGLFLRLAAPGVELLPHRDDQTSVIRWEVSSNSPVNQAGSSFLWRPRLLTCGNVRASVCRGLQMWIISVVTSHHQTKMRSLFASKGWVWKTKQFTDSNQSPSDDLISVHRASDTGRFSASQQLQNKKKLLWVSAVSQFCLWTSSADGCGRRTSIQERKSGDSVHREPECVYTGMYFLETI